MIVKELIKRLKKFKPNLPMAAIDNEMGEYEISEVKLGKVSSSNVQYFNIDTKVQDDIVELS